MFLYKHNVFLFLKIHTRRSILIKFFFIKYQMYSNYFFFKIIIIDYLISIFILIPVFLRNKNFQNIEKKIIKILIWILLGLPFFFIFIFKLNFFLNNIYLFLIFFFINTITIIVYFEKIEQTIKKKKYKKYYWNKQFNFNYMYLYIIFLLLQTIFFI